MSIKKKLVTVLHDIWKGLGYNKPMPSSHEGSVLKMVPSVNVSSIIGNRSDYTSEHDFSVLVHTLFSLREGCSKSNLFAHVLNKKTKEAPKAVNPHVNRVAYKAPKTGWVFWKKIIISWNINLNFCYV